MLYLPSCFLQILTLPTYIFSPKTPLNSTTKVRYKICPVTAQNCSQVSIQGETNQFYMIDLQSNPMSMKWCIVQQTNNNLK